jgi:hypothetical protein
MLTSGSRSVGILCLWAKSRGVKITQYYICINLNVEHIYLKKNGVFWDVTTCGSCKNRRFGVIWHAHHLGDKNQ